MKTKKQNGAKQATIQKAYDYFLAINNHLEINNGQLTTEDNLRIAKKYYTASYLIYHATNKGFYQRTANGVYKLIKVITNDDVKLLINDINKTRMTYKPHNGKEITSKKHKPRNFTEGLTKLEKFFVVNQSGEIHCKPTGIRNASAIALKNAKNDPGKRFFICEISKTVEMEYVPTVKEI